jgi:hypothetical protein
MKTTHYKNVLLRKNRHREKKRTQSTTQEYNVEISKPEKELVYFIYIFVS